MLFCAEMNEKINNGVPIPTPNSKKFIRLLMKLVVDVLIANRTTKDAGLQGRTIAPKNNPKINALQVGLSFMGALNLGKIFPMSKLKIIKMLIMARTPKAIGLIIPIAFVKDS